MNEEIIKLSKYGHVIGPRVLGMQIKDEILQRLEDNKDSVIIIDLNEIDSISTGFSKELFGGLYSFLKDNFKERIKFNFDKTNNTQRGAILMGLQTAAKNKKPK